MAWQFNKVEKALELLAEIKAAGEKALVFTGLRGLYETLETAFKLNGIHYVGMRGVATKRRNEVARRFEASAATVLLAGTETLNRGVTINGANHVLICDLQWSPEATLQAEDRCHRPGQEKEVHVHYLLSDRTIDEHMWNLVQQKWAAQRAVQDREVQHKGVEEILADAALAKAELAVAQAVLEQGFSRRGASAEEAAAQAKAVLENLQAQQIARQPQRGRRRRKSAPVVVILSELLGGKPPADVLAKATGPVQLAFF